MSGTTSVHELHHAVNAFGSDLTPAHKKILEERWITPEIAEAAGLRAVDNQTGRQMVGQKSGDMAGIAIPYFTPAFDRVREYRIRRDNPEYEVRDGARRATKKYVAALGRPSMIYLPVDMEQGAPSNRNLALLICEGEFKVLAADRLSRHGSVARRFLPIGISGAFNWRTRTGKKSTADGTRADVTGPLPDWSWFAFDGRDVIIAFDTDARTNGSVRQARAELRRYLRGLGARVGFLEWDAARGKGLDDHLAMVGPDVVLAEIEKVSYSSWRDTLMVNKEGEPRSILANAITALSEAPEWLGVLAYNDFSVRTVAKAAPPWPGGKPGQWTDQEDRLAANWFQRQGIFVSVETAGQAIQAVSQSNSFHPVREFLDSDRWDGVGRIDGWLTRYLGVDPSDYSRAVGARWLISAVARIYEPGAKADCCLILEGRQGLKKSTALKTLADPWYTDEIAEMGTKDSSLQTKGVWIIEIAELDSMSKAEIGRAKAFMSRGTDRFRPPYGRRLIDSPRQCVFAGSVNLDHYLRDETGGRRFWPVRCGRIDIEMLARDRAQLWAEAAHRYRAGENWWLDSVELNRAAEAEQQDRYEGGAWDGIIARWGAGRESVSIEEVLTSCIEKPKASWTQGDRNAVSKSLRSQGWIYKRVGPRLAREWRFFNPSVSTSAGVHVYGEDVSTHLDTVNQ